MGCSTVRVHCTDGLQQIVVELCNLCMQATYIPQSFTSSGLCMHRGAIGHSIYTCCSRHLLNIISLDFILGGLDYHEPGTDPLSCNYSLTVPIPAGDNGGSGIVAVINDSIYELQEEFYLDLSVAQEFQALRIREGSPLRATVQIKDDDGETECFTMLTFAQVDLYLFQDPLHH